MATHSSVLAWRIPGQGSLVGCRLWGRKSQTQLMQLSSSSSAYYISGTFLSTSHLLVHLILPIILSGSYIIIPIYRRRVEVPRGQITCLSKVLIQGSLVPQSVL